MSYNFCDEIIKYMESNFSKFIRRELVKFKPIEIFFTVGYLSAQCQCQIVWCLSDKLYKAKKLADEENQGVLLEKIYIIINMFLAILFFPFCIHQTYQNFSHLETYSKTRVGRTFVLSPLQCASHKSRQLLAYYGTTLEFQQYF